MFSKAKKDSAISYERMVRVARAYYKEKKKQWEIAKSEGLSRQMITKILQQAEEEGIVTFHIHSPVDEDYLSALAAQLRSLLPLKDVQIVPAIVEGPELSGETVFPIAQKAAQYISQLLNRGEGKRLVVSPGRIIRHTVNTLRPERRRSDLQVVPFIGFLHIEGQPYEASVLAWDLARAYGAQIFFLPVMAYIRDSHLKSQIEQLPEVQQALEVAKAADLIITGVGKPSVTLQRRAQQLRLSDKDQRDLREIMQRKPPVGEIAGQPFDSNGCVIEELEEIFGGVVGLTLSELRERVEAGASSIGIVGGDLERVPGILAAIRAKYINILITDHLTAQELIKQS
jgi:DNA-binding transcriptional regulator LsrR (DeoR family)